MRVARALVVARLVLSVAFLLETGALAAGPVTGADAAAVPGAAGSDERGPSAARLEPGPGSAGAAGAAGAATLPFPPAAYAPASPPERPHSQA